MVSLPFIGKGFESQLRGKATQPTLLFRASGGQSRCGLFVLHEISFEKTGKKHGNPLLIVFLRWAVHGH
jgi:hypothetical protein